MELSIPRTSIRRIIRQIGLKPYRSRLIHGLLEDDPARRLQFSEIMLNKIEENPEILDNIVWSDEASFKLSVISLDIIVFTGIVRACIQH